MCDSTMLSLFLMAYVIIDLFTNNNNTDDKKFIKLLEERNKRLDELIEKFEKQGKILEEINLKLSKK